MKRTGFTLIELMCVVFIISVIAALALPMFRNATGKAKKRESLMVLKQIYQMETSYKEEYGHYCESDTVNSFRGLDWTLPSNIRRYDYTGNFPVPGNSQSLILTATEKEDADGDGVWHEEIFLDQDGNFSGDWHN